MTAAAAAGSIAGGAPIAGASSIRPSAAESTAFGSAPGFAAAATQAPGFVSVIQRSAVASPGQDRQQAGPGSRTSSPSSAPSSPHASRRPAQPLVIGNGQARAAGAVPGTFGASGPAPTQSWAGHANAAAGSPGMPTVQRAMVPDMIRSLGDRGMNTVSNTFHSTVNGWTERLSAMPRSIGGAFASLGVMNHEKHELSGTLSRGDLSMRMGGQINQSSPLRSNPQMWTDLMAMLEMFAGVLAETHAKQTKALVAQSLASTDETLQTMNRALSSTNMAMSKSLEQVQKSTDVSLEKLLQEVRVDKKLFLNISTDEDLYSSIVRRLRIDLRTERERFGRLRDGMR